MAFGDADVIRLFEAGEQGGATARAAAVLAALRPDLDREARGAISLGDRDRMFWSFKTERFGRGTQMLAKVQCADCGEWISLDLGRGFDIPDKVSDEAHVHHADRDWALRLPNQSDLAHLGQDGFPYHRLHPEAPWSDPGFLALAETAIEAADPGIDVVIDVSCPDCGGQTPSGFDALSFLWADIEARANQVFADVGILARAFGWTEAESLELSPWRRARYVEMVQ